MDTRFWGPSGWQLFHLIAFHSEHPHTLLRMIPEILPCKFCRASSATFAKELPLTDTTDAGRWLYDIHRKVNQKLRSQCSNDPNVVNPGEDPSYEDVKTLYKKMTPKHIPGRDFLMAVATNFPVKPTDEERNLQIRFWKELTKVYPFPLLRKTIEEHTPVHVDSRTSYQKSVYDIFTVLATKTHAALPSWKGYIQHVSHYKSTCSKKTYRGVTCRKAGGGRGLVKQRDHRKTFRITRASLL